MKPARSLIPIGTATLLPDTARRVRALEQELLGHLTCWGYKEIIPPAFEYLDVLSGGLAPEVLEKCYKFADWTTGRILVLRPDITAQIARIVAMNMGGIGLPLRLSYRTTVYRYEPEHAGREREIFQVGVELIGADDPFADAEILTLLVEGLKRIGLPDFKVTLGHVGFYKALLRRSGLSVAARKRAEIAVAHKDVPGLEDLVRRERVPRKEAKVILDAVSRCGQEDVLKWGRRVAGRDAGMRDSVDRLDRLFALLEQAGIQEHILVDLGEFRGFDYYDGVVFDVFSQGFGCELGGGGRYDHLLGKFGRDLPSTGFALNLERVFAALDHGPPLLNVQSGLLLVVSPPHVYRQAFRLSQSLRAQGVTVIQDTCTGIRKQIIRNAQDRAKRLDIRKIAILGAPGLAADSALLVETASSRQRARQTRVSLEALPALVKA